MVGHVRVVVGDLIEYPFAAYSDTVHNTDIIDFCRVKRSLDNDPAGALETCVKIKPGCLHLFYSCRCIIRVPTRPSAE